jgi:hypothetical protein
MLTTVTQQYIDILESNYFRSCFLVDLPGPLRLTDGPSDVVYQGNTYLSNGLLVDLDGIAHSTEITANTYTVTIDNANTTALALYGSSNYIGMACKVYLGLLNEDGTLIVDGTGNGPIEIYSGLFDSWGVSESANGSSIKTKLKSHWASFKRRSGRYTNSSSQQEVHPSDTFFDHAHLDANEIKWGQIT